MSDTKHFRHFKRTHVMSTNKCDKCDGEFTDVQLTRSTSEILTVKCNNGKCDGLTLAVRKGKGIKA